MVDLLLDVVEHKYRRMPLIISHVIQDKDPVSRRQIAKPIPLPTQYTLLQLTTRSPYSMSAGSKSQPDSLYPYSPSHALPAVFATLIGISLLIHVYQNL